jgi:hypothetical protein
MGEERVKIKINKAKREGVEVDEFGEPIGGDTPEALGVNDKSSRWNAKDEDEPIDSADGGQVDKNGRKVRDRRLGSKTALAAKAREEKRLQAKATWASSGANAIGLSK